MALFPPKELIYYFSSFLKQLEAMAMVKLICAQKVQYEFTCK